MDQIQEAEAYWKKQAELTAKAKARIDKLAIALLRCKRDLDSVANFTENNIDDPDGVSNLISCQTFMTDLLDSLMLETTDKVSKMINAVL